LEPRLPLFRPSKFLPSGRPPASSPSFHQPKPPRFFCPRPGIVYADSRKCTDLPGGHSFPAILKPNGVSIRQIESMQRSIDLQLTAKLPWPVDQLAIDFNRSNQYRRRKLRSLRDYIQHVVHAINKIDIGHPRVTKKDFRSCRSPFRGMAGLIISADISFHFDDFSNGCSSSILTNQILSDEGASYHECGLTEERTSEELRHGNAR
jgi:hypothetical protein